MVSLRERLGPFIARRTRSKPAVPLVSSVVAPPTVAWPSADATDAASMPCPNCGARGAKPLLLVVSFATPDHPMRHAKVLRCPHCTCAFYEQQIPPDYTEGAMLGRGRVGFYLQQGAGVSLITRPLCQLRRPPGSRYLEVGCGFGFGLDFAVRAKGWHGTGIDPGQVSALGRDMLGVDIALRYLGDDEPELASSCDVVMASETIEHVRSPIGFARTLRRVLRPGGILVLTTPDAADLRRDTAPGALVGLLSPGLHLVFQNATSLETLLRLAGFSHVELAKDGYSLVAFASDAPFDIEQDPARLRAAYLDYLEQRFGTFPPTHDLFLGFAGRAFQEAVNDGDLDRADRVFPALRDACQTRFGLDLATMSALPDEARTCSLERLGELVPLALGGILHADSLWRLGRGETRSALEARFQLAAEACDMQRRALGELAMEDAMSEEIAWAARAEAVLCAATRAAPDLADRLGAISGDTDAARRQRLAARAVAILTSSGEYAMARDLAAGAGLQHADWSHADVRPLSGGERDALFALAVLDAQPGGDAARGRARFAAVRAAAMGESTTIPWDLYWSALRGEVKLTRALGDAASVDRLLDPSMHTVSLPDDIAADAERHAAERVAALVNAGQYEAARPLAVRIDGAPWTHPVPGPGTDAERDALFALAVLDGRPGGDLSRAARRFATVRAVIQARHQQGTPWPGLYWAALRGEAQALDGLGREADLARLLDPDAHGDAPVSTELAELTERLECQRLLGRVNAGDYQRARAAADHLAGAVFQTAPASALRDHERDALFALAVLDQLPGGDSARAAHRFARVRESLTSLLERSPAAMGLYWSALRGEATARAAAGEVVVLDRLLDPSAHPTAFPNDVAALARRHAAARLVALVNEGNYDAARPFAARIGAADDAVGTEAGRDTLFALAVLDAQPGGDPAHAAARFAAVRRSLPPNAETPLYWPAVRGEADALVEQERFDDVGELLTSAVPSGATLPDDLLALRDQLPARHFMALVHAGRYTEATPRAAGLRAGVTGDPATWSARQRDLAFGLAMLDSQPGRDPREGVRLFRAIRSGLASPAGLYWSALRGEVTTLFDLGQIDEAEALLRPDAHGGADVPPDLAVVAERNAAARLVALVNDGRYDDARALAGRVGAASFAQPPFPLADDGQRDALFALAVLDAQPGGDPAGALARFAAVRAGVSADSPLYWSAVRGEVDVLTNMDHLDAADALLRPDAHAVPLPPDLHERGEQVLIRRLVATVSAGRYDDARSLANRLASAGFLSMSPDDLRPDERDAVFSLAILDLRPGGDPGRARARFASVRAGVAGTGQVGDRPDLYWQALRGELETHGESDDIAAVTALLDRHAHGGSLPTDLADAIPRHAARRLVAHVSAGRFADAWALAGPLNASGFADGPPRTFDSQQRDAAFCLAMLDLQPGGDPDRAQHRFAAVCAHLLARLEPGQPMTDLFWSALRGQLIALDAAGEGDEATARLEAAVDALGHASTSIPDDLRGRLRDPARLGRVP